MKFVKALALFVLLLAVSCSALAEPFELPEDTQVIEDEAFLNCVEFTGTLAIPDTVLTIGDHAFQGCTGFTGVPILPGTLRRIGAYAFAGCTGLSGTLVLSPEIDVDETAFVDCPNLTVVRGEAEAIHVAVILDEGGVSDNGFNQAIYEAAARFCEAKALDFDYYIWNEGSDLDAVIEDGCNVVLAAGFGFAELIAAGQADNPDVRFIGLDISADDLGAPVGNNVFCATYREEQAGFLAGYAAVKLGYTHLGFLGGMSMPPILRYGYGFVQGVDAAAVELGIAESVEVEFSCANQFWGDPELTARMAGWYGTDGVQVVFACGGGIYTSVAEAAAQTPGAKVIGVDVDQRASIDGEFGAGLTLTSAMKNLGATVNYALGKIVDGTWEEIGGTSPALGIVGLASGDNHVGLAPSTQFGSGFSAADYEALLGRILDGTCAISGGTDALPGTSVQVNER